MRKGPQQLETCATRNEGDLVGGKKSVVQRVWEPILTEQEQPGYSETYFWGISMKKKVGDPLHLEGGKDTKVGFFPDIGSVPVGVG